MEDTIWLISLNKKLINNFHCLVLHIFLYQIQIDIAKTVAVFLSIKGTLNQLKLIQASQNKWVNLTKRFCDSAQWIMATNQDNGQMSQNFEKK